MSTNIEKLLDKLPVTRLINNLASTGAVEIIHQHCLYNSYFATRTITTIVDSNGTSNLSIEYMGSGDHPTTQGPIDTLVMRAVLDEVARMKLSLKLQGDPGGEMSNNIMAGNKEVDIFIEILFGKTNMLPLSIYTLAWNENGHDEGSECRIGVTIKG